MLKIVKNKTSLMSKGNQGNFIYNGTELEENNISNHKGMDKQAVIRTYHGTIKHIYTDIKIK